MERRFFINGAGGSKSRLNIRIADHTDHGCVTPSLRCFYTDAPTYFALFIDDLQGGVCVLPSRRPKANRPPSGDSKRPTGVKPYKKSRRGPAELP